MAAPSAIVLTQFMMMSVMLLVLNDSSCRSVGQIYFVPFIYNGGAVKASGRTKPIEWIDFKFDILLLANWHWQLVSIGTIITENTQRYHKHISSALLVLNNQTEIICVD